MTEYFVKCNDWVLETPMTSKAKMIYIALIKHMNNKTKACFPSKKRIAELCMVSVSTVTRALRELKQYGLISIESRYRNDGGQTSKMYKIIQVTKEFIEKLTGKIIETIKERKNNKKSSTNKTKSEIEAKKNNQPEPNKNDNAIKDFPTLKIVEKDETTCENKNICNKKNLRKMLLQTRQHFSKTLNKLFNR